MGWTVRSCWSCWLLLGLAFGDFGVLARRRRQSDRWRNHQQAIPGQGPSRWGSRDISWGVNAPVHGFGSYREHAGGMARQLPQAGSPAIRVQCGEDVLTISLRRDFLSGRLVNPSDLSLGSQPCKPTSSSTDTVIFQVGLQDCGNTLQMTPDWMIYSANLTYSPTSSRNVPITRTNSAVIPINCHYDRHGNVSSKDVRPTWLPFSTTVTNEERFNFSLQLMADDWSGPRDSMVYQLGDIMSIEASVSLDNHISLILFVDSCVATISPDPNSSPRYEIINANGCLVDGKEDSSSAFVSPRIGPDRLQFTVDAFRFLNVAVSVIYITCQLRVAAATQIPDSMNKACSYSKDTNGWSAVEGSDEICQCCETGTCNAPPGESRVWGSFQRHWKRDVGLHLEERGQVILGPILVIGEQDQSASRTELSHASKKSPEPKSVELLMIVSVASISLVLAAAAVTWIGKCVLSKLSR